MSFLFTKPTASIYFYLISHLLIAVSLEILSTIYWQCEKKLASVSDSVFNAPQLYQLSQSSLVIYFATCWSRLRAEIPVLGHDAAVSSNMVVAGTPGTNYNWQVLSCIEKRAALSHFVPPLWQRHPWAHDVLVVLAPCWRMYSICQSDWVHLALYLRSNLHPLLTLAVLPSAVLMAIESANPLG